VFVVVGFEWDENDGAEMVEGVVAVIKHI